MLIACCVGQPVNVAGLTTATAGDTVAAAGLTSADAGLTSVPPGVDGTLGSENVLVTVIVWV